MRKILLSCIGVAVVAVALFLGNSIANSKKKKRPVPEKEIKTVLTDTVKNTEVQIVVPANGSLVAKKRIALFSEVQGLLKPQKKEFKTGQAFKKGEAILKIDATEYYATVQASKSNFYNALVSIMPDLKLDFPDQYPKWQSYVKAFSMEASTPKLPSIASEKEKYFITGRGVFSAYYNVKNLEERLTKYTIRAPFSGIVTEALITEGALVRNGQNLGSYIAPGIYEMEVALSKQQSEVLEIGKTVTVKAVKGDTSYTGKIIRINGSVDVTTQTVAVFIELQHKALKEGMYLEAQLNGEKVPEAIEIPRYLLLENNNVFCVKDGMLEHVAVQPIHVSNTSVIVTGLPNGTVLLKKPVPGAYVGMAVKAYSKRIKNTNYKN